MSDLIRIRDLKPTYRWLWSGCSFSWVLEDEEYFSFEEYRERDYVEYIVPDWQRGHVWTEEQQIAYIEFCFTNPLEGGNSTTIILAEMKTGTGDDFHVKKFLVDGLQRTTAVRRFMKGEIPAFGKFRDAYYIKRSTIDFRVHMLDIKKESEALELYLRLNGTGTPHTKEELKRAEKMLKEMK